MAEPGRARPGHVVARYSAWRSYGIVLLPLALLMLLGAVHFDATRTRAYMAELRGAIADRLDSQRARIESRIVGLSLMLRGMQAAIEADPNISAARYNALARVMMRDNPEILNIAAAPGLVVKYVFPPASNAGVVGLDYRAAAPAQSASIHEALRTGRTIVAGPLTLIQTGRPGFILRRPVTLPAGADGTTDGTTANGAGDATGGVGDGMTGTGSRFWGVLSLVIDAQTFYRRAGLLDLPHDISFALRGAEGRGAEGAVFLGDPAVFAGRPLVQTVPLPSGNWEIAGMPRGGWPTVPPGTTALRLAMAGLAALVLAAAAAIVHLMRRHRAAREQMASAIAAIDDGFALFDAQDRLVMCNQRYRDFYALSGDLIRPGRRFDEIIRAGAWRGQYPDAVGREEAWVAERLAQHRRADSVVEQELADGRWLQVSERRTSDGSTVGFRVDVTELKRAKEAAEEANRIKADFLSVLSHELRTPLTVILGFARFLSDRQISPALRRIGAGEVVGAPVSVAEAEAYIAEVTQRAGKIETAGSHLLALINDLLDFSKIEAGKMELEPEDLPLDAVVAEVLDSFQAQADAKGLRLGAETGGVEVHADPVRLRQVLINLVGNALKFTETGGIAIAAERIAGRRVAISVTDSGCGIAPEMTERIFNEFQQADSSSTRRAGGTGLGLAICRRIVEMHGGTIGVTSAPGRGSTFTFTMPAHGMGMAGTTAGRPAGRAAE